MGERNTERRSGAIAWLVQHLSIAWQFARIGLIRKSQFRFEFANQVVMDCVFYLTHILLFEFLFQHTQLIAGWSLSEVRVYLGFIFVSDAFSMVWLGQSWHFGEDLKKGNLDPVRARPASPIVLYFYQRFSPEGLMNMAIALGYFVYGVHASGVAIDVRLVSMSVWAMALSFWGRAVLAVLLSIAELYLVNSDVSRFAHFFFSELNDRPLDVFHRRVKQFLVYLMPVGAMSYLPACMVLGRMTVVEAVGHTTWVVLLGLVVHRAWRASFRRYESAMS